MNLNKSYLKRILKTNLKSKLKKLKVLRIRFRNNKFNRNNKKNLKKKQNYLKKDLDLKKS